MSEIEERALEAARILRDFCGEWDCPICPFIEDVYCRLSQHSPVCWKIPNKEPARAGNTDEPKG